MSRDTIRCLLVAWTLSASVCAATSAEWPQWGGPQRNFTAADADLQDSWKDAAPRELWRRSLGGGRAAFVVDGDTLYTMHGGKKRESVVALDAESGTTRWQYDYVVSYQPHAYDGPHSTPTIAPGRLIAVSIDAKVHALDLNSGELLWSRDLVADHGVKLPQFGYAASPLFHDGLVLLPGLGGPAPGALALKIEDGATAWARHDFLSSHASPMLIRVGDRDQAVFHGMDWLYGLDPRSGDRLWRIRLRTDAYDNVSFTPLWDAPREQLVVSHGYDNFGAQALKLRSAASKTTAEKVWNNRRLNVDHGNGVLLDGVLYASHRADPAFLVAVDLAAGETRWRVRMPKATLLAADGKLLLLDEEGELYLARPDDEGPGIVDKISVLRSDAWTVPTLVGKRLYLRDGEQAVALELP